MSKNPKKPSKISKNNQKFENREIRIKNIEKPSKISKNSQKRQKTW